MNRRGLLGGDGQSTNGAEASHMHTRMDLNFDRGYEYWLMAEAKKRNPRVTTYGLSWAAPGWINNGSQWDVFAGRPSCPSPAQCAYFSADNIKYQTNWVIGAKRRYNITVDYLGTRYRQCMLILCSAAVVFNYLFCS